jgi:hypothetical protein
VFENIRRLAFILFEFEGAAQAVSPTVNTFKLIEGAYWSHSWLEIVVRGVFWAGLRATKLCHDGKPDYRVSASVVYDLRSKSKGQLRVRECPGAKTKTLQRETPQHAVKPPQNIS